MLTKFRNLPEFTFEDFKNIFKKTKLENYCLIHFESRNFEENKKMIDFIRNNDPNREIKVSVELEKPKLSFENFIGLDLDYLFIEKDFALNIGLQDIDEVMTKLAPKASPNCTVICPWGESGAKAIDNRTNKIVSSPIYSPKTGVIDTLGAGDTFVASTLFALQVLKLDLQHSIQFGCKVAGAKCGFEGYELIDKFENML